MKMHVVYPGSFDPPTLGHLSIVNRAKSLFGRVTVMIGVNPFKKSWLEVEDRYALLVEMFKNEENVDVVCESGLVAEAVKKLGADAIIKGIRSETDLRSEQVMAEANSILGKGLETLFLTSKGELQGVSSSLVRQIFQLGGDVSPFVPASVYEWLKQND